MLVLELTRGDRVRVNGTTDVIVVEIHEGQVEIGIQRSGDSGGDPEEYRESAKSCGLNDRSPAFQDQQEAICAGT